MDRKDLDKTLRFGADPVDPEEISPPASPAPMARPPEIMQTMRDGSPPRPQQPATSPEAFAQTMALPPSAPETVAPTMALPPPQQQPPPAPAGPRDPFAGAGNAMVGSTIGPWSVQGVVHEEFDLRRYGVRHLDGRVANIDIARTGSTRASTMISQASWQGAMMGVDPFHHPYVVFNIQDPRFRQPVPAKPGSTAKLVLWITVPIVLVFVLLGVGMYNLMKPPKRPQYVSAHGSWGEGCDAPFHLEVRLDRAGTAEVLGKRQSTQSSYDTVEFDLTRQEVGKLDEIVVRAGLGDDLDDDDVRETRVSIRREGSGLGNARYANGEGVTLSSVGLMSDGTPMDVRPAYEERSGIGSGHATLTFDNCDLATQSSEQGVAKVEVRNGHASIDVDVARLAWTTGGDKITDAAVLLKLEKTDGTTSRLDITTALTLANDPFSARAANVAKQPLVDAPAVDSVAKPRPIAVVWDKTVNREYLHGAAPAAAPYVAVVDSSYASAGSCGPYEAYAGGGMAYATKKQWRASAKLYEARTGKLVAQRAFAGSYPECPYTIMMTAYGSTSDVTGSANDAAVKSWLKALQK